MSPSALRCQTPSVVAAVHESPYFSPSNTLMRTRSKFSLAISCVRRLRVRLSLAATDVIVLQKRSAKMCASMGANDWQMGEKERVNVSLNNCRWAAESCRLQGPLHQPRTAVGSLVAHDSAFVRWGLQALCWFTFRVSVVCWQLAAAQPTQGVPRTTKNDGNWCGNCRIQDQLQATQDARWPNRTRDGGSRAFPGGRTRLSPQVLPTYMSHTPAKRRRECGWVGYKRLVGGNPGNGWPAVCCAETPGVNARANSAAEAAIHSLRLPPEPSGSDDKTGA